MENTNLMYHYHDPYDTRFKCYYHNGNALHDS